MNCSVGHRPTDLCNGVNVAIDCACPTPRSIYAIEWQRAIAITSPENPYRS
ncbi:MAG: hypothetical protein LDL47_00850 [Cyanobacteria bacterium KgW148]|nr:hypothetical protein [Cyanobacteria bacterium KgW148]